MAYQYLVNEEIRTRMDGLAERMEYKGRVEHFFSWAATLHSVSHSNTLLPDRTRFTISSTGY